MEKSSTHIKSATKARGGGTSTFPLEDNPMDSIIHDLEGVRFQIAKYELQMQHVEEMVGNPPRGRVYLPRYKMPSMPTPYFIESV